MIDIEIKVDDSDERKLRKLLQRAKKGLLVGIKKAILYAEGEAKKNFNKSGKPKVRTGTLRRSIKSGVSNNTAWIGSDVVYARIIEKGGVITAKNKPYLSFQIDGKWFKKKSVTIPPRPYLQPAISEHMDTISRIIAQEIVEEMEK